MYHDFFLYDLYDWDKELIRRLYRKDSKRYECAYTYMFSASYHPNQFIQTLEMQLK